MIGTRAARAGFLLAALAGFTLTAGCSTQEYGTPRRSRPRGRPPETEAKVTATTTGRTGRTTKTTRTAEPLGAPDPAGPPAPPRINLDPHVLLARADAQLEAGQKLQAVRTLEEVLAHLDDDGRQTPSSQKLPPRASVEERIRQLGYERHGGAWIPKDSLLSSYGWRFENGRWNPPDSRRLCNMLAALTGVHEHLRELPAGFYDALSSQGRISRGMNRREVIQAWGYFDDISVVSSPTSAETYDELVFSDASRRVYLRRGEVLFWVDDIGARPPE